METVSFQRIGDRVATHIVTACEDADTCPGCGAGYKAGLSACEYCRRPVRLGGHTATEAGSHCEPDWSYLHSLAAMSRQ